MPRTNKKQVTDLFTEYVYAHTTVQYVKHGVLTSMYEKNRISWLNIRTTQ